MCGFGGYSLTAINPKRSIFLDETLSWLRHRGPDDSASFDDKVAGIGLAHTRLAIQDLSPAGHQPMQSHDRTAVVVFNGEIYNFQGLRAELAAEGVQFRGTSDTEVLLNLYQSEGEEMLFRLNGIFTFAIWDQAKQKLFLARDALGVKPLYYAVLEDRFVFASEIKALMPLMPKLGGLDKAALDRYLTYLWCPGEGTPFEAVRKLMPGQAMWVNAGQVERHWSWYRLPLCRGKITRRLTATSAAKETIDHLRTAVHRQLISDVPVGAFLSGGLDSSAIVALAREKDPDIRCFTIDAAGSGNEGMADDLPYAKRVAEHLKVPLEVVRVDPIQMAMDLPNMVAQLDEPLADPAPLNVLYISRLARQRGIKVLLSGAGGDDLFTGYRRHRALMTEKYWNWLPGSVLSMVEAGTHHLNASTPLGRRLRKLFNGAALKGDDRLVNYFRWIKRADLLALYTHDFRAALAHSKVEAPMLDLLTELPADTEPLERMLALEKRFFLADHNLTYTDKMSMAVGVEVRVPFLDLELVEFAAQIPARYKQRGNEGKWVLKKAMEPYLPRDVIYRPKSGFGAPLRRWLKEELRDWLADTLSPRRLRNRGLFNPEAVERLIRDNAAGRVDASYTLLSLACIEMWCQHFIDKPNIHKSQDQN